MAKPSTARSGKFKVMLGNSASPIVYSAPCGLTSKSLTLSKELTDVNIPDCDDPDAVDWIGRDAASLSAAVSGEGVLAAESVETWLDAFESAESVPVKIVVEFPARTITWTGSMHITTFTTGTEDRGRVTATVEMQSDGELVRTSTANT